MIRKLRFADGQGLVARSSMCLSLDLNLSLSASKLLLSNMAHSFFSSFRFSCVIITSL